MWRKYQSERRVFRRGASSIQGYPHLWSQFVEQRSLSESRCVMQWHDVWFSCRAGCGSNPFPAALDA